LLNHFSSASKLLIT